MGRRNIIVLLVFIPWFLSSGILAEDTISKGFSDSDLTEYTLPQITVIGNDSLHTLKIILKGRRLPDSVKINVIISFNDKNNKS